MSRILTWMNLKLQNGLRYFSLFIAPYSSKYDDSELAKVKEGIRNKFFFFVLRRKNMWRRKRIPDKGIYDLRSPEIQFTL